jgi:hypothetical protein
MADLTKAAAALAAAFGGRVEGCHRPGVCWICGNEARSRDAQGRLVCPLHEGQGDG